MLTATNKKAQFLQYILTAWDALPTTDQVNKILEPGDFIGFSVMLVNNRRGRGWHDPRECSNAEDSIPMEEPVWTIAAMKKF